MNLSRLLVAAGACATVACSSSGTEPRPPSEQLTIAARPSGADSILAEPIQALVVQVRWSDGMPQAGSTVRFQSLPGSNPAVQSMFLRRIDQRDFRDFAAVAADPRGQAAVQVKFGFIAGVGRIEVSVPGSGVVDTVGFTILPGAPRGVLVEPRDTTIHIGATAQYRARVVDQFGNARPDPVTLTISSAPAGIATVDGAGRMTTAGAGLASVVASAGAFRDTAQASVVPAGQYGAVEDGSLVVVDFDGTGRRVIDPGPLSGDLEPAWSPTGNEFAIAPSGVSRRINLQSIDGGVTTVTWPAGLGAGDAYWPAFSPDGQFVYFTNYADGPLGIWRIRRDGTGLAMVTTGGHYRPSVSADGRFVTFHAVSQTVNAVVVQVYDMVQNTFVGAEVPGRFPEWAPSGNRIAFLENDTDRIVVMESDGTNRRYVTAAGLGAEFPLSWSPDGRWLLARGQAGLELVDVATGVILPLGFTAGRINAVWISSR